MKLFYYLGNTLATHGPSFHLICAHISYFLKQGNEMFVLCTKTSQDKMLIPDEFLNHRNFKYQVVEISSVSKSQFVKRYLNSMQLVFKCRKYLKIARDYDVMFVESSVVAPFKLWAAKKYGKIPVLWNIQDMFPGSSIASGIMPQKWMQSIFYAFQKIAYRKADWITVISEDMKEKVVQQGVNPNKITTILNWFDDSSVREVPWEENRFVKEYNLAKDIFYVQYAGTTGYVFDYEAFLYIANAFKENPKIRFQIIAKGSQYDMFRQEAKNRGLENFDFLPLQPQNMVSDVYSACSVCYIPLKYGVIGNSVPSKAGLLMACKRPVINSVDPDSKYYHEFGDNQIGISASNLDYEESVKAIQYLFDNPKEREQMGLRAYFYGKDRYSSTLNLKLYEEVYQDMLRNNDK